MKKALDLIDDTERLLAEADENLKALEAIHDEISGVEAKFAKLQALVKKFEAASLSLQKEKLTLLMLLIRMLLYLKVSEVRGWSFDFKSGIRTSLGNEFTFEIFCSRTEYRPFCEEALKVIATYFLNTSIDVKNEREFLERLLEGLKTLGTGKGV